MVMDRQTFRDLEIYEATGGPALFDLLNRTRTAGGEKALRARLGRPWSNPEKIRAVQQALHHIIQHRNAFDLLPGEGLVSGFEQYLHCGLALLETNNRFEQFLEPLEVRVFDRKQYKLMEKGVQRSASFLRSIARFAERPDFVDAPGELGPLLNEMRTLIQSPAFSVLPQMGDRQSSCWQLMQLDRVIRLDQRPAIERILRIIFELDALVSMADAIGRFALVLPEVTDGPVEVIAEGIYHPFLTKPVPNALQLDQTQRLLFVTGPNMAGKTTYLRACGIAVYLAHLGMGVPARAFRFSPCDCLYTAISLTESIRDGVSFFRAEALRVKTIAQALANGKHVVGLLDEPFMGTNVKDALDASRAVLTRLAQKEGSVFLVSSHLIELGEVLLSTRSVACYRFEASEQSGRLQFDYLLRPGMSSQRLGVRVLKEEGVFELLDRAAESAEPEA
jgi:DNA mismatch repair protein MutS